MWMSQCACYLASFPGLPRLLIAALDLKPGALIKSGQAREQGYTLPGSGSGEAREQGYSLPGSLGRPGNKATLYKEVGLGRPGNKATLYQEVGLSRPGNKATLYQEIWGGQGTRLLFTRKSGEARKQGYTLYKEVGLGKPGNKATLYQEVGLETREQALILHLHRMA